MSVCPLCRHDPESKDWIQRALYDQMFDRAEEFKAQLASVTQRLLQQRARLRELERLQGAPPEEER